MLRGLLRKFLDWLLVDPISEPQRLRLWYPMPTAKPAKPVVTPEHAKARARHFEQLVEVVRRRRKLYQRLIYEGDPKAPVRWILQEFNEWLDNEVLIGLYSMHKQWITGPDGMPVCFKGVITEEEYTKTYSAILTESEILEAAIIGHEGEHQDE